MGVKKYFGERPQNNPKPFKAQFGNDNDSYDMDLIEESKPVYYPSPAKLAEYEEIQEGAADRILTLVEKEQKISHDMIAKSIHLNDMNIKLGQLYFVLLAILVVAVTVYLSFEGYVIPAAGLGLGGMVMLGMVARIKPKSRSNNNRSSAYSNPEENHKPRNNNGFDKKNNFRRRGGRNYRPRR